MYLCQEMLVYCLYICYYYYDCISTASLIYLWSLLYGLEGVRRMLYFSYPLRFLSGAVRKYWQCGFVECLEE